MTNLSLKFREELKLVAQVTNTNVKRKQTSKEIAQARLEVEKIQAQKDDEIRQITIRTNNQIADANAKARKEVEEANAKVVSLGNRILRCETAAIVANTLVMYSIGELSK